MEVLANRNLFQGITEEPTSGNVIKFAQRVLDLGISIDEQDESGGKTLSIKSKKIRRDSIFPRNIRSLSIGVIQSFEGRDVMTEFKYPFGSSDKKSIDVSTSILSGDRKSTPYVRFDMMTLNHPNLRLQCQEDQSVLSGPFSEAQLNKITGNAYMIAFKTIAAKA